MVLVCFKDWLLFLLFNINTTFFLACTDYIFLQQPINDLQWCSTDPTVPTTTTQRKEIQI